MQLSFTLYSESGSLFWLLGPNTLALLEVGTVVSGWVLSFDRSLKDGRPLGRIPLFGGYRQEGTHKWEKLLLIFFLDLRDHLVNAVGWVFVFDLGWEAVVGEEWLVLFEFKDGKYLLEGHIDWVQGGRVVLGSTVALVGLFAATGVSLYGRFCLLNHVVMETLALLFLPMMHLKFINLAKWQRKSVRFV